MWEGTGHALLGNHRKSLLVTTSNSAGEPEKMSFSSSVQWGCPSRSPRQDGGHLDDPIRGSAQWSLLYLFVPARPPCSAWLPSESAPNCINTADHNDHFTSYLCERTQQKSATMLMWVHYKLMSINWFINWSSAAKKNLCICRTLAKIRTDGSWNSKGLPWVGNGVATYEFWKVGSSGEMETDLADPKKPNRNRRGER